MFSTIIAISTALKPYDLRHCLIEPWVPVHVLVQLFGLIHTSTTSRSL